MTRSGRSRRRRFGLLGVIGIVATLVMSATATRPATAASYVPVSGAGSTWSQNALAAWISDVRQYGMRINYEGTGSTDGRHQFLQGTVDFAASDIPFQSHPEDGSAPEDPAPNSYAYMPITAGGTTFMYNLVINGQRVTNLRLSGENIAKIFTGQIVNWSDPLLKADNPQLDLPNRAIIPVVRSDGSGSTAQFTMWMINQYPQIWNAYCQRSGRAPSCGSTSFYPTISGMIAQSGDLGVAGYVAQNFAQGAIGYVNYSYALNERFPVAEMLNRAGYYTEPTPENVAVSLLQAQVDTTDVGDPSLYLTQKLDNVYIDPDPRTYPLSSYSYLILPTQVQGEFNKDKGATLAAFSYYAMCQGQQESASLGYSPMPVNLVQDSFAQITKIPGAVAQNINIQSCHNPTFTSSGQNLLATEDPMPPACAKQGSVQCATGSGGDRATTPLSSSGSGGGGSGGGSGGGRSSGAGGNRSTTSGGSSGSTGGGGGGGGGGTTTTSGGSGSGPTGGTTAANGPTGTTVACDPDTGECPTTGGSGTSGTNGNGQGGAASSASLLSGSPVTLQAHRGWGTTQWLMVLAGLLLLALIVVPGLISRYVRLEKQ